MDRAACLERVEGTNLVLRLIRPDDAEYVYSLRTDPAYNEHLSQVTGTVDDQRDWIIRYKQREATLQEFYYVIERKDAVRCGLVRLYDLLPDSFTWGSWMLDSNKPPKAALESAVLSFGVGFDQLAKPSAFVDVRIDNHKAESIYRHLGMDEIGRDPENIYFRYARSRFEANRGDYLDLIGSEQNA